VFLEPVEALMSTYLHNEFKYHKKKERKSNSTIKRQITQCRNDVSPEKNIRMANTYMTKCSTPLVIREMKTEDTRKHFIPTGMAAFKKIDRSKCW
jgi:hypothetical protein